ncbi:MAG TPA: hypothetical protein PLL77_01265 [Pyrinomonadaceae bacterium]|nr:hypothetical protein [Pyrinomonadaceae bacterium]
MDSLEGYVADDELAVEPLAQLGFKVDTISWRDTTVDWNDYEAVVIRTPWDYQRSPDEFLNVLKTIDNSSARLENSLDIVRWNLDKRYLIDMERRGCRIVPTIWDPIYAAAEFNCWLERFGSEELIIKPTVSATAEHTYRLTAYDPTLDSVFSARSFMVQPFMPNIIAEGEYSLFFFNGEYSHTINKSPKTADFRVQEEHGGIITEVEPNEKLRIAAQNALDKIGKPLLYARVDLVRDERDEFALMELELIEPALYLRMSKGAPERFAAAIETLLK